MRLGVTADIHASEADGSDAPGRLFEVLAGVDRVIACGDHTASGVLGRLAEIAPLTSTRNPSASEDGEEFAVLDVGPQRIGVVFSLPQLGIPVAEDGAISWLRQEGQSAALAKAFGGPVDVVLFGGTHQPLVASSGGVLFVNPGSPRFAARTTAAIVDVSTDTGVATVEIVDV